MARQKQRISIKELLYVVTLLKYWALRVMQLELKALIEVQLKNHLRS